VTTATPGCQIASCPTPANCRTPSVTPPAAWARPLGDMPLRMNHIGATAVPAQLRSGRRPNDPVPDEQAAQEVLNRLVSAAGLPSVQTTEPVDELAYGLDNKLTKAVLADDREVLLRISSVEQTPPLVRTRLLQAWGVSVPRLYAATDTGATLWEFVPGRPLGDLVEQASASDRVWHLTGAVFATVHAVRFPAPLQGTLSRSSAVLQPLDPVDQLHVSIADARPWVSRHRPQLLPVLTHLHRFLDRRAGDIRAEQPCLTHGDANLLNVIVGQHAVRLIDWDFPAVRYPLAELSALDEHVYLHGGTGLPPAFFAGYGRHVPAELLLAYRICGCLAWLSSNDWAHWKADVTMPRAARQRLNRWHDRLLTWAAQTPQLAASLDGL
jgi:aminoglycoside phosphotransferase (APT) family kinase protein